MVHTEVHSAGVYRESQLGMVYLISKATVPDIGKPMFSWITIAPIGKSMVEVFSFVFDKDETLDLLNGRNGSTYEYLGRIGFVDLTSLIR